MTKGEIAGALRDLEGAIEREDEAAVLVALFRLAQLSLETIVSMAGSSPTDRKTAALILMPPPRELR